jgi:hypothetical protein
MELVSYEGCHHFANEIHFIHLSLGPEPNSVYYISLRDTGLSAWRSRFNPRPFHAGFMVDTVTGFSQSTLVLPCSIIFYSHTTNAVSS